MRQTWMLTIRNYEDGHADHTCHRRLRRDRRALRAERFRRTDHARAGRRGRYDDRHRGEGLRPSSAGAAAPGILRLPLRRRGATAAPAPRAGQIPLPGVWSNTCCGHPYPDEPPFVAAARRTAEELGLAPALLREAGTVRYNHPDPASGLVEQEYNHVFAGLVRATPRPDPEEICDIAFVTPDELDKLLRDAGPFSAWFLTVLDTARPVVRELTGSAAGW
ncbi:hypothetical protein SVIO_084850 [Streptomyces violaceusniger]|uniref:isopentenyl-diphosphate Delta-isomerase n=1 Tax=Streptomyces violaceusniger TaxID=68280 RepID=A0A4D4L9G6_STRVO|nr:hypothetical protein SVIO_084850 [Streptomyces violaceusniger]